MSYRAYLRGYVGLECLHNYTDRDFAAFAVGFADNKAICLGANMAGPKSAGTVEAIVDSMVDTVNPLQVRLAAMQAERDEALAKVNRLVAEVRDLARERCNHRD